MEETLPSPKLAEIDLLNNLERINSEIPDKILNLEGFISSTTHPIEIDSEKKVIALNYII